MSQHWPKPYASTEQPNTSLINFKDTKRDLVLSVYQGDFQEIGYKLAETSNNFEDFQILTNVPYGVQSSEMQR